MNKQVRRNRWRIWIGILTSGLLASCSGDGKDLNGSISSGRDFGVCFENLVCKAQQCVVPPCQLDIDCPDDLLCSNGSCIQAPCRRDSDCIGSAICSAGSCGPAPCVRDSDCLDGLVCEGDSCSEPPCVRDDDCAGGDVCTNGSCEEPGCTLDADCDDELTCEAGSCVVPACGSDDDCPAEHCLELVQVPSSASSDVCQQNGWYNDGQCDSTCPNPDPDCDNTGDGGNTGEGGNTECSYYSCNEDADVGCCSGYSCYDGNCFKDGK